MIELNTFGIQRLEYLRSRQPHVLKEMEDDGVLKIHLFYTQKRAGRKMELLVMAGMEESEAAEIVLREIIQT